MLRQPELIDVVVLRTLAALALAAAALITMAARELRSWWWIAAPVCLVVVVVNAWASMYPAPRGTADIIIVATAPWVSFCMWAVYTDAPETPAAIRKTPVPLCGEHERIDRP